MVATRAVGIRDSAGTKDVLGLIAGGREAKGESQLWRGCLFQSGADVGLSILGSYVVDC